MAEKTSGAGKDATQTLVVHGFTLLAVVEVLL